MKFYAGIVRSQVEADVRNRRFLAILFAVLTGIAVIVHSILVWKEVFTFLECAPIFIVEFVLLFATDLCYSQMKQWIRFRDKMEG